jgi:hypothetical protein
MHAAIVESRTCPGSVVPGAKTTATACVVSTVEVAILKTVPVPLLSLFICTDG